MSVTLFYCPECDHYTKRGAIVLVEIEAVLNVKRGGLSIYGRGRPLSVCPSREFMIRSECPRCGESTKLVVLDECPHRWNGISGSHPPYRVCEICDEKQDGRVVFDE